MSMTVPVNAEALREVLVALNGPGHLIREACSTPLPIPAAEPHQYLISDFNAWVDAPNKAAQEAGKRKAVQHEH